MSIYYLQRNGSGEDVLDSNDVNVGGAGMVNVIYGTDDGLDLSGNQGSHQGSAGIPTSLEANDQMGLALY